MSDKASKEEIINSKLKNAFRLIKQERYTAARQILREFPDNPKAKAMLRAMEGKTEKRQGFSAISKRTLLMLGMGTLLICIIMGTCLLFTVYFSQYSLDELFVLAMAVVGDTQAEVLAVAINYCKISQSYNRDTCAEWPLVVYLDFPQAAESCFSPYAGNFLLEEAEVLEIRECLYSYGVPRTY